MNQGDCQFWRATCEFDVNSTCNVSLTQPPSYMKTNSLDSGPKPCKKGAGVAIKDKGGVTEEGGSTDGGVMNEGGRHKRGHQCHG